MNRGWFGGIAFCCSFLFAFYTFASEQVFVNGDRVVFESPIRWEMSGLMVPVASFPRLLGVDSVERSWGWDLRGRAGRADLPAEQIEVNSDGAFISLDSVLAVSGAVLHRVGDSFYIETTAARLTDFTADGGQIVLRFDRFTPMTVETAGKTVLFRFHDCESLIPSRTVSFSAATISEVRLVARSGSVCELAAVLHAEVSWSIRRYESAGYYSVAIDVTETPEESSTTVLSGGLLLEERSVAARFGKAEVSLVYAETWAESYDVRAVVPPSGVGTSGALTALALQRGAVACMALQFAPPIGLVVADGVPLSIDEATEFALAFDRFDRLLTFTPEPVVYVDGPLGKIALDGVNRPIGPEEVVAYPPEYPGQICRGLPDTYRVVKLRDGVVVSVYDGAYVLPDRSATLIVASGRAKARLAPLTLGARAELGCAPDSAARLIAETVPAVSVLVREGIPILDAEGIPDLPTAMSPETPMAWSVLATDWRGGLILLTVPYDSRSAGLTAAELASLVLGLSYPIRDAVILNCSHQAALCLTDERSYHLLGSASPVYLGFAIIPRTP